MKRVDYSNIVSETFKKNFYKALGNEYYSSPRYKYGWGTIYKEGIYQENEVERMRDMGWVPVLFMELIEDFVEEYNPFDLKIQREQLEEWILPEHVECKGLRLYKRPREFEEIEGLCMNYRNNLNIDNSIYQTLNNTYEIISIELLLLNIIKHRRIRKQFEKEFENPILDAELDDALSYLTEGYFGKQLESTENEDEGIINTI
jgi:hypothetical protein